MTTLLAALLAMPGGVAWAAEPTPAQAPQDCVAAQNALRSQARTLLEAAPELEVLLLGEIHTSRADHAWQLATLVALNQQSRPLALALEMVPAARQAVLDRYVAGELDEAALLEQVGWQQVWGHDPELYLPMLRWARLRGVPLLALNADPTLVQRVRREGLAAIPAGQRDGIDLPRAASAAYRARLQASWSAHSSSAQGIGSSGGGAAAAVLTASQIHDLQRFIDSQLLRDRAMAERIAAAQRRDPARLVVVLIGQGHLEGGDGVQTQLHDLGLNRLLSLERLPLPAGCTAAPAGARMGAYLESDDGVVLVRQVAPGSAAAAAGLQPGDRILELNGMAVHHAGEVIRGVRLHPDGQPLLLTVERAGRRLRIRLRLPPRSDVQQASGDNGAHHRAAVLTSALLTP